MIVIKNLRFTYPGNAEPTIRGIGFQIEAGEIFGFLGPSGAGKSTTQKILVGLYENYHGQATIWGRELKDWHSDYYERVGVAFEVPNHYLKLTGRENLRYFQSLYAGATEQPDDLLGMVGLTKDADVPVAQYSKGMKVRLGFARALLAKPELVFLDEPTAGLDPVNARMVKDIIRQKKAAGATIFLTTHDMTVADQLCDRVAFIVNGELKLIDSPRNLKLQYGRHLVRVEFQNDGQLENRDFPLDGLADNTGFLDTLRRNAIQTIHSQETTLENIFIEVTGHHLQ
ncbi:MAG: ABC transporter ATP-binding protein [Candidatus Neomarinimicrobiota bacterium]